MRAHMLAHQPHEENARAQGTRFWNLVGHRFVSFQRILSTKGLNLTGNYITADGVRPIAATVGHKGRSSAPFRGAVHFSAHSRNSPISA